MPQTHEFTHNYTQFERTAMARTRLHAAMQQPPQGGEAAPGAAGPCATAPIVRGPGVPAATPACLPEGTTVGRASGAGRQAEAGPSDTQPQPGTAEPQKRQRVL